MWTKAEPAVLESEHVLKDDYPVNYDYWYLVDGRCERSDVRGTVRDLRRSLIRQDRSADEVRRCDLASRRML